MFTAESRRRDFPSLGGMAYLNTAAECIPPVCVREALETYWADKSLGMRGREAHYATLESARHVAGKFLGLSPGEVGFCSSSSEAYNLLATALDLKSGDEVVVSDLDFPSGATPWLASSSGCKTRLWRSREGALLADDLVSLLNERTRLVQVSLVSFYNGFRLEWEPFHGAVRSLAPNAVLSVDLTQALGRIVLDCPGADIAIASSYKWTLGIHGGCIIGVPQDRAGRLTTRAGGWYHLANAFDTDRFERAVPKPGAASFMVGMPSFPAVYALNASLHYLDSIGVVNVAHHADPLVQHMHNGLRELRLKPMAPHNPAASSGIVAFRHPHTAEMHKALEAADIHVMHQAGRMRIALHGYNTHGDVRRCLDVLARELDKSP
ncbi:MAG: aminotransferase class V-fold PLP-dependent enzyme [Verrucomicrobia bacterium]|nr:aminotransferase class V-fold PLP-dependent enzyme [Verrucomicrobiota bacterium]